jgi:hypothetical protein
MLSTEAFRTLEEGLEVSRVMLAREGHRIRHLAT